MLLPVFTLVRSIFVDLLSCTDIIFECLFCRVMVNSICDKKNKCTLSRPELCDKCDCCRVCTQLDSVMIVFKTRFATVESLFRRRNSFLSLSLGMSTTLSVEHTRVAPHRANTFPLPRRKSGFVHNSLAGKSGLHFFSFFFFL